MTKLAPEWVRNSDPVIRSPARYRWTTAPASGIVGINISTHYIIILYKPGDKAHYDSNNKVLVDGRVDEFLTEDITDTPVKSTVTQVRELCHSLKKNKAAGWNLITGEHMIYGSDTLYNILALIVNHISASHNVPVHFRKVIIVHIPKGKDKNLLSKDNHRGITLVSVVSKVYEKLLLSWLELNCPLNINRLQGACVYGSSSLNCAYILRETVSKLCGDGSTVYVCLLDAKKAFDTVWNKGLFYKLAKLGCNIHLWHILFCASGRGGNLSCLWQSKVSIKGAFIHEIIYCVPL